MEQESEIGTHTSDNDETFDVMTVCCALQITTPDVLLDPHGPHPGAVLPVNESSLRPPKRTHFLYVNLTQPLLPTGQLRCVSLLTSLQT